MKNSKSNFYLLSGIPILGILILAVLYRVLQHEKLSENTVFFDRNNTLSPQARRHFQDHEMPHSRIGIHPILVSGFQHSPFMHLLTDFSKKLAPAVTGAVTTQLMREVILNTDLQFLVSGPGAFTYDAVNNTINIGWERFLTVSDIKHTMRNELHHAMVRYRNQLNGCKKSSDTMLLCEPYCDKNGKVISTQAKALTQAIELGHQNVLRFNDLITKQRRGDYVNQEDVLFLEKGKKALADHIPFESVLAISMAEYHKNFKPFLINTHNPKVPFRLPKEMLAIPFIIPGDQYFHYFKEDDGKIIMRYTFSENPKEIEEKINAFIAVWRISYHKYSATHQNFPARHAAEMASSIEEYTPSVKAFFFNDFCQFFSQFHQINDYCAVAPSH